MKSKRIVARRYRNRRIGDFLKELEMTEGRCTGIPKIHAVMQRNGSPRPKFTTDELRTWFLVELPVHSEFAGKATAQLTDQVTDQVRRLLSILAEEPRTTTDIMLGLKLTHRPTVRTNYLKPALDAGL